MNYQHFDLLRFGAEFAYSVVIIIMFLFIYLKTKGLFKISKYRGIRYFRNAFLLLALAYASRLLYHSVKIMLVASEYHVHGRVLSLISLFLVSYFGSVAIGYLIYSSIWKKVEHWKFLVFINLFVFMVILLFPLGFSLLLFIVIQLGMIAAIFIVNRGKKIRYLYSLVSLFWIFNMIILYSRSLLSFEAKLVLQVLSVVLLSCFISKVSKWVK